MFVSAIVIPIPIVHKWSTMHLTPAQWIIAGSAAGLLMLQIVSYGLLFSLRMGTRWSRLRHDVYQLVIYVTLGLAFILGIWKLRSVTISECEFMLGLALLGDLVMAATFLGTFFGILKSVEPLDDQSITRKSEP